MKNLSASSLVGASSPLSLNPTTKLLVEVVRVRTSTYSTRGGLSVRRDITVLRRRSHPEACLLQEDINATSALDTANRIINLVDVEDGVYKLVTCNERHDYESGIIDDYDLMLVPLPQQPD
jgi:hypothetical protein